MALVQPDGTQVELEPTSLLVKAIKIYHYDDYAREIVGIFAVTEERRVIGFMKPQVAITLQRPVLFANAVQPGNDILEAVRRIQVAVLQFKFFGVQVLFLSRRQWGVLAQLKGGTVNPIARAKCCGQNKPDHERRAAADLKELRENIWSVRPKIGSKVLPHFGLRQFCEIVRELLFGVAPREIGARLGITELCEAIHYVGPGERFGKEQHVAMLLPDLGNDPFPE